MSKAKAFLHERIIYEYMEYRANNSILTMNHVVENGKLKVKKTKVTVDKLDHIETSFPDINNITIKKNKNKKWNCPAEVKFLSSEFNYHKEKIKTRYNKFKKDNGCIIVLKHDFAPNDLIDDYPVNIFELDYDDFVAFVHENFRRLLHKQLLNREGDNFKIWVMSQSKNFYEEPKSSNIMPAKKSNIWCPTDNLTDYDLSIKDKIIFVKFGGLSSLQQVVQKNWIESKTINEQWLIKQLWIAEVTEKIMSRKEYCDKLGLNEKEPLWNSERNSSKKLWPKVFKFKKIKEINCNLNLKELHESVNNLVHPIFYHVLIQQKSVEISTELYIKLLEYLFEET